MPTISIPQNVCNDLVVMRTLNNTNATLDTLAERLLTWAIEAKMTDYAKNRWGKPEEKPKPKPKPEKMRPRLDTPVSVSRASRVLGVSRHKIQQLMAEGALPTVRPAGGKKIKTTLRGLMRVYGDDIDAEALTRPITVVKEKCPVCGKMVQCQGLRRHFVTCCRHHGFGKGETISGLMDAFGWSQPKAAQWASRWKWGR